MILNLLLNFLTELLGAVFQYFPVVNTLPAIGGYDIDSALVSGMGEFNTFVTAFWPIQDMFYAFLFLMGYYGIKVLARLFLGSRAPGKH